MPERVQPRWANLRFWGTAAACALMIVALFFALVVVVQENRELDAREEVLRTRPPLEGRVVDVTTERSRSGDHHFIEFSYVLEGRSVRSERLHVPHELRAPNVGEPIEVWIDERRPGAVFTRFDGVERDSMTAMALLTLALCPILVLGLRTELRRHRLSKHGAETRFRVLRSRWGMFEIEYFAGGVSRKRTLSVPTSSSPLAFMPPEDDAVLLIDPADPDICIAILRERIFAPPGPLEAAGHLRELLARYLAEADPADGRALGLSIQRRVTTDPDAEDWIRDLNASFASRQAQTAFQQWLEEDCMNHSLDDRRSLLRLAAYRKLEWHLTQRRTLVYAIPATAFLTVVFVVIPGRPLLAWMPPVLFCLAYFFVWLTRYE